eukprot:350347_1
MSTWCSRCLNKVTTPHSLPNCPYIDIKQKQSIQHPFVILITNGQYVHIGSLNYIHIDKQLFIEFTAKYQYTIHIIGSDLTREQILQLIRRAKEQLLLLLQNEPIDGTIIGLSGHGVTCTEGYPLFLTTDFHRHNNRNGYVSIDEILDIFRDPSSPNMASLPKICIFDFCLSNYKIRCNYKPKQISNKYKQNEIVLNACTRGFTSIIRPTGSVMWRCLMKRLISTIQNPIYLQTLFTETARQISDDITAQQTVQSHSTLLFNCYLVPRTINFNSNKYDYTPDLAITFSISQITIKATDPGRTDLSYYMVTCNGSTYKLGDNIFLNHGQTLTILHGTNQRYLQGSLLEFNTRRQLALVWIEDIVKNGILNKLIVYNAFNMQIYEINMEQSNSCCGNNNNNSNNINGTSINTNIDNVYSECKENDNDIDNDMECDEIINDNQDFESELTENSSGNMNGISSINGINGINSMNGISIMNNINGINNVNDMEISDNDTDNDYDIDDSDDDSDDDDDGDYDQLNITKIIQEVKNEMYEMEMKCAERRINESIICIKNSAQKLNQKLNISIQLPTFNYDDYNIQESSQWVYEWQPKLSSRDMTKKSFEERAKGSSKVKRWIHYGNDLFPKVLKQATIYGNQCGNMIFNDLNQSEIYLKTFLLSCIHDLCEYKFKPSHRKIYLIPRKALTKESKLRNVIEQHLQTQIPINNNGAMNYDDMDMDIGGNMNMDQGMDTNHIDDEMNDVMQEKLFNQSPSMDRDSMIMIFFRNQYIYKHGAMRDTFKVGNSTIPQSRKNQIQTYDPVIIKKYELIVLIDYKNSLHCSKVDELLKKDKDRGIYRTGDQQTAGGPQELYKEGDFSANDLLLMWFMKKEITFIKTTPYCKEYMKFGNNISVPKCVLEYENWNTFEDLEKLICFNYETISDDGHCL